MADLSTLNRSLKSWPGWLLLGVVAVVLLVVGGSQDSGPETARERVDAIAKQIACPTCDGESVYESRASSSENVRREITRLVNEGQLTDEQIVRRIDDSYAEDLRLEPSGRGLEGLAWVLPVVVAVLAVAGLAVAFRRWKAMNAENDVTEADRALVEAALARSHAADDPGAADGPEVPVP